jgi:MFS family permease
VTTRQRLTLIAAILGSGVATIDGSIVNVALPAIEHDLGGGLAAQQWVSNLYLLTLGSFILIGGSLADIYGERRVFTIGVAAFGVFSLACAAAPTIGVLLAARALQGLAGALLVPSSLAVIVSAFAPQQRDNASWRWIFAINAPLIIATLGLVLVAVPAGTRTVKRPVDYLGAVLCVAGLGGVVFGFIEEPRYGWGSPAIFVPLIAGAISLVLFIRYERVADHPMLKLELFSRRNFSAGNIETFSVYAGLSILFFFLVIFLQEVAGYDAIRAGLTTLPVTIIMFVLSRRFGAMADRYGPRFFMGVGPLVSACGILLLLRTGLHTSFVADLLPGLIVFGLGLALTVAPLTATVLADADESDAGIASAINNAVARVAGLVGISVMSLVISGTLVGDSFAANSDSVHAFHEVLMICAALVAAGGLVGVFGIVNTSRAVEAESCAGGQLVGHETASVDCSGRPALPVGADGDSPQLIAGRGS